MDFKILKNTENLFWTKHSIGKMKYYGLSEQRIKRVLRNPGRTEEGIAPNTVAMMQPAGSKKHPYEIWLMYTKTKIKKIIISAWRYPGVSPRGRSIPIPDEMQSEIEEELKKLQKKKR